MYVFRDGVRARTKRKHPQNTQSSTQNTHAGHHVPHIKYVKIRNNIACIEECVKDVHVCPWKAFIGADGYAGT